MHGNFRYDPKMTRVKDSPIGPGEVTNTSMAGYPEVNCVAVAWLVLEDGTVFDPDSVMAGHIARRAKAK